MSDQAKNLGTVERTTRLLTIHKLREEGLTAEEISEAMEMSLQAIRRNFKYLDELDVSDITPEVRGQKRAEIAVEYLKDRMLALQEFEKWKTEKPAIARNYLLLATSMLEQLRKLWGAEPPKIDSISFNQFNTYAQPEKVDREWAEKYAEAKLKDHQKRLADK